MHESERHRIILSAVQERPVVTVADLCQLTGASEATMLLQDEERTLEQAWLVALVNGSTSELSTLRGSQLAVADSALARLTRA